MRGRTRYALGLVPVLGVAALLTAGETQRMHPSPPRSSKHSRSAPAVVSHVFRRLLVGRSRAGAPLLATEIRARGATRTMLVIGCVHGDESAGIGIARRLDRSSGAARTDLWVLDDLNPDGVRAATRQNAAAVDLNRNFPWHWQPLGRAGDQQYSGPAPLSEPESRAAYRLILRLHPSVTIWFHQPLATVDESGGSRAVERRFAVLSGLPLRRLERYPGSAVGWQNQRLPDSTAFVVELPRARADSRRYAAAVLALAETLR